KRGGDRAVELDQVALRVSLVRPEDLLEVREADGGVLGRRRSGRSRKRGRRSFDVAVLDALVVAQPQKHRMSQAAIVGPLLEAHLADDLGLDPGVAASGRDRSGAG